MLAALHQVTDAEEPTDILARIPASAELLRSYLTRSHAARKEYAIGTWRNMRVGIFKALLESGVRIRVGLPRTPLPDEWQRLFSGLDKRGQVVLYRFMRWCAEHSLGPADIKESTFEAYERYLHQFDGRARPRQRFSAVCRAWDKAASQSPGWPTTRTRRRSKRDWYILQWGAFSPSFKGDIDSLILAELNPDPFQLDVRRPTRPVGARTARQHAYLLRRLASALVAGTGRDPGSITCIADVVEPTAVREALRFVLQRAKVRPSNVGSRDGGVMPRDVHNCATLLCSLARWWVQVPEDHLKRLRQIVRQTKPATGLSIMTPKNRKVLRNFEDSKTVARYLTIPDKVFARHRNREKLRRCDALELQSATAVAILTVAPVRVRNLSLTRIGINLLSSGGSLHLHYPRVDVKNNVELEFALPDYTRAFVEEYISRARPVLCGSDSTFLFPGRNVQPKSPSSLGLQIANFVERQIGVRLTAHQFRHLAGFLYLTANPNGHEVVRLLLGHKHLETTLKFYLGMEESAAHKTFDDFIARRRHESRLS
jgi:integrase